MIIRTITEKDFPAIIWQGLEEWEEHIYKDFNEMEQKGTLWLVAEENGEPIGQIMATIKGKFGKPYLFALRVRPDYQKRGIGTQLIARAENDLVKQGAKVITIAVDFWNDEALRLYEKLGYKRVGKERQEHWTRTHKGKVIEEDVTLIDLEKNLT